MSALCPQCGQAISDDFGVIVCPHCQAVLFVDLSGNVQLSADSHSSENILQDTNSIIEQAAESEEAVYIDDSLEIPEGLDYKPDPQAAETQFGTLARFQNPNLEPESGPILQNYEEEEPSIAEFVPTPIETSYRPTEIPNEDFALIDEDTVESEEEVEEFTNPDLSAGPLTYTVVVEGIDTKQMRVQLQEALDDPKFHWSSNEIIRKIRQGKITLKNLSPVKASVLIARLKETPMKLSWTQHVYK